MTNFKIISDSVCDLDENTIKKYDIGIVPLYITLDGVNYLKESEQISIDEFYKHLLNKNCFPKTSLPSVQDYINAFKPFLDEEKDIFCVCVSAKFSGSYQSALNASNILKEKYFERNIIIIDSYCVTFAEGFLIKEACRLREQGKSILDVKKVINKIKLNVRVIFTLENLEYLQKGGRIGKASALMGSLLGIRPILALEDGEIIPKLKVRGTKKAFDEVVNIVVQELKVIKDYEIAILYSGCIESVNKLKTIALEKGIKKDIIVGRLGTTVVSHTGPTCVAIAYMPILSDEELEKLIYTT